MEPITIPTDGLSVQEVKTVQSIQKALNDARKGLVTADEVKVFIDEKVKDDKAALATAQTELKTVKSEAEELKAVADQMQNQIRRLSASGGCNSDGAGYRGKFRSAEEARAIGLMMMGASLTQGLHIPEIAAKHARVMKALEKTGHELVFVEEKSGKRIEKAATTGSQASGSLLVTSEMAPGMILLLDRYGKFRSKAQIVPMGAGSTLTPKSDTLLTMYVPGEGTAPTVTDPTIGAVNLIAKALTGLMAYSMELDEDSAIAMAELYGNLAARSCAYYEDLVGFLGDGTSAYFGMRGIAGAMRAVHATISSIKSVVVGSGNAYSELVYGDFEACVGKLPDYADTDDGQKQSSAEWYMNRYFYYTVFVRAALAAGAGAAQEIILGTAQRQKLGVGFPVNFVGVMPKAEANDQHCATFGDLSLGAQFGTRGVMEFAQSDQRYFDQGLIALRVRERIAINAHGVGNTTKEGPMIALYTAGS